MNLISERIILRAIEKKDRVVLQEIINDPNIEYQLGGYSFPISSDAQEKWIEKITDENNTLRCIVQVKENKQAIGVVMLTGIDLKNGNAEIHIKLKDDKSRKSGYGTETINLVVDYAFNELRLQCVYAKINDDNIASQKLFNKCHFEFEGTLKQRIYKRGRYKDILSFVRIREK